MTVNTIAEYLRTDCNILGDKSVTTLPVTTSDVTHLKLPYSLLHMQFVLILTLSSTCFLSFSCQYLSKSPINTTAPKSLDVLPLVWSVFASFCIVKKIFRLRIAVFSCQYRSTDAWYSSEYYCYQKDKRARLGNLSNIGEHWTRKYFHIF
jgi:hypothetical protein